MQCVSAASMTLLSWLKNAFTLSLTRSYASSSSYRFRVFFENIRKYIYNKSTQHTKLKNARSNNADKNRHTIPAVSKNFENESIPYLPRINSVNLSFMTYTAALTLCCPFPCIFINFHNFPVIRTIHIVHINDTRVKIPFDPNIILMLL